MNDLLGPILRFGQVVPDEVLCLCAFMTPGRSITDCICKAGIPPVPLSEML